MFALYIEWECSEPFVLLFQRWEDCGVSVYTYDTILYVGSFLFNMFKLHPSPPLTDHHIDEIKLECAWNVVKNQTKEFKV